MASSTPRGFLVVDTPKPASAAGQARIRANDVITKIDDTESASIKNFSLFIQDYEVGDVLNITLARLGHEVKVQATLLPAP